MMEHLIRVRKFKTVVGIINSETLFGCLLFLAAKEVNFLCCCIMLIEMPGC